ncbi:MAG: hypothetical protein LUD72_05415 [Bacteroidales bacterium]|nr:hypothetical protein [Bacteroidales bacterium]
MAELKDIPTSELISELGERFRGDDYLSREFTKLHIESIKRQNLRNPDWGSRQRAHPQTAYKALSRKESFECFYYILKEEQQERVEKYFPRAIRYGFITVTDDGCVWDSLERRIWGAKSEFAVFISLLLNWDNGHRIPYVAIQRLFGVSRMGRAVASVFESRSFVRIEKILKQKIFF